MPDSDRTASLMSPAKLARMQPQVPVTPAAWLDQMAADAGHQHVKRIEELAEVLREQASSPELAAVAAQLERLAAALPALDFALLQSRGWWARTSGKSRSGGVEFAGQFERIDEAARSLAGVAATLGHEQQADAALAERALVELEVEYRAMEKIIDQGARWLQDMRNQLKLRQAEAVDVQAQQAVLEDAKRCDILVSRLKMLRSLCNAASQVIELARATAERRTELAQTLQRELGSDVRGWHARLHLLAEAAGAGKTPSSGLQRSIDSHDELQSSVKKAVSACGQLLVQEQALVRGIAALGRQPPPA
jgi:hypothetical protein